MTTVSDIVRSALSRIRELPRGQGVDSEDAALGRDLLNGMILRWPSQGVDAKYDALALTDTFTFFVPPATSTAEVIAALDYQGAWDADANSPSLATGTGTLGYFYKVSTAGSTTLDDVTSWAVGDYAVFNGSAWLQSINPSRFDRAVIDMLAVELCPDFGKDPSAVLVKGASDGWRQIMAAYIKPQTAGWDRTLVNTYARPWMQGSSYDGSS